MLHSRWKKVLAVCVSLLCLLSCTLAMPMMSAFAAPSVNASSYVVMDAESGQVLFGKNRDEQYDPASITKVMTLGLACQKAAGDWSTSLTVSYEDVMSLVGTGSSHIALQEGEVITLEDALYATMMQSANDAANVLASYLGGDIAGGVALMNAQAEALGLVNTHFDNPHGLDTDTHKVTAADMAVILRWAMAQPRFLELFCNNETYIMQPTNRQTDLRYFSLDDLARVNGSSYYVPEITGSKTGYTDVSRFTYVALAEADGRQFIVVSLHSEQKTDRYADAKALVNYAFLHFQKVALPMPAEQCAVEVYGGGDLLGTATVAVNTPTQMYLYDGQGAEMVTHTFEVSPTYVVGGTYHAQVVYSIPESANQAGASVTVPLDISGVDAVLAKHKGTALDATATLVRHKGGVSVVLVIVVVAVLVLIAWWRYNVSVRRQRAKARMRKRANARRRRR